MSATLRLKMLRAGLGLTQTDLAKALGVTLPTYHKKENNPSEFSQREIETLKTLFGVEYDEIFLPIKNSDTIEITKID